MFKLIAAAALAAASLLSAPAATADSLDDFLTDMEQSGFRVSSDNEAEMLAVGLSICVDLLGGYSVDEEIASAIEMGLTPAAASDLVGLSVGHLCPSVMPSRVGRGLR